MKRCVACILPETYPGITFDGAGVCNYCANHQKATLRSGQELTALLASYRNRGRQYDCIVGVSGGKDSSYALYYLAKIGGLRVLAYMADHGFVHETAKDNARNVAEKVGVPLVIEEHDHLRKVLAHNLSSWLRKPSPGMIPMLCSGCRRGMYGGLLRYAKAKEIPLVALGIGGPVEVYPFKSAFLTENPLGGIGRDGTIHSGSTMLGLVYEVAGNPSYFLKPANLWTYLAESFYFFYVLGFPRSISSIEYEVNPRPPYRRQRALYLGKYTGWDEQQMESTLRNELGWKRAGDRASAWHFDCHVSLLRDYLYRETVGFTEVDDKLSMMIREEMISRKEALTRLGRDGEIPEDWVASICQEIGISFAAVRRILARVRD